MLWSLTVGTQSTEIYLGNLGYGHYKAMSDEYGIQMENVNDTLRTDLGPTFGRFPQLVDGYA